MKTRLPYCLILLLFPFSILAQSNFKKGFAVTVEGDTLKGFIDFREWNQNPKSFAYKSTIDAKIIQELTPVITRYVSIESLEDYLQYKGPISQDKVVLPKISTGIDTSTITDAVFLKVLQQGKNVSLYSYRDIIKTRFFLRHHDQQAPQELIYRIYYKIQDAKEQSSKPELTVQSKLYIGQLWFAANKYQMDTPELKKHINLINYSEPDIFKTAGKINGVTKEKAEQPKVTDARSTFFAGVGVNRTTVKNTGENVLTAQYSWDAANSIERRTYVNRQETMYAPKFNAGIDFAPFPKTRKFLLRSEFSLTTTHFNFSNIQSLKYPDREILYDFTFKQVIVAFTPQVIYNLYNANRIKFYLGAGASYNQCFYPENRLNIKPLTPGTGDNKEVESNNYMPFAKSWINFPLRAGILVNKRYDLSIISWTPTTLAQGKLLSTKANSVHIGVNYVWN